MLTLMNTYMQKIIPLRTTKRGEIYTLGDRNGKQIAVVGCFIKQKGDTTSRIWDTMSIFTLQGILVTRKEDWYSLEDIALL